MQLRRTVGCLKMIDEVEAGEAVGDEGGLIWCRRCCLRKHLASTWPVVVQNSHMWACSTGGRDRGGRSGWSGLGFVGRLKMRFGRCWWSRDGSRGAREVGASLIHVSEQLDDRLLVKLVQDWNGPDNVIKWVWECPNDCHNSQLIIEVVQREGGGWKQLDNPDLLLNLVNEWVQGLSSGWKGVCDKHWSKGQSSVAQRRPWGCPRSKEGCPHSP